MPPSLRILAFEPYDACSHLATREAISRHSRHRWTWVTRPGHAWKWRMRLAAVEMVHEAWRRGLFEQPVDALFATSLMSVADLRSLLPRPMRGLPIILYVHENQATYPAGHVSPGPAEHDAQFALTNLTSLLAADRVIWNSDWNRRSFLAGIGGILKHAPSPRLPDIESIIRQRSQVIWPPVELPAQANGDESILHNATGALNAESMAAAHHSTEGPAEKPAIRVAWPHRWEHDKGPDRLLELAMAWSEPLNLRWSILGGQFRTIPPALDEFHRRLADRIDVFGFEPDHARYQAHLAACDWVLSTTRHEFFGIAMVEAMFQGCLPWIVPGDQALDLPPASEFAGRMIGFSYDEILPAAAKHLDPRGVDASAASAASIRQAIRMHLEPAIAPNAVRLLDDAVASTSASAGCAGAKPGS